jgi:hypothetical protein
MVASNSTTTTTTTMTSKTEIDKIIHSCFKIYVGFTIGSIVQNTTKLIAASRNNLRIKSKLFFFGPTGTRRRMG